MTGEKTVRIFTSDLKSLARSKSVKARADDGTTVRIRSPRGGLDPDQI